ncbi:MAG: flavodoxin [Eubacteriales bacterium]|nr:flavodoxin [Eubacteriales bacterium]
MKRLLSICLLLGISVVLAACGSRQATAGTDSAAAEIAVSADQTEFSAASVEESAAVSEEEAESAVSIPETAENQETQEESVMQTTQDAEGSGTLIAYFSLIDIVPEGADASTHATPAAGNTESAAMEIQRQAGGDLFAIHTVEVYPVLHREASEIAGEENRADARPELSTHVENMEQYDTIFIGYPIWWYEEPMAIRTFLEEYDFTGKTIVPFCTTLGAGVGESVDNIRSLVPDAAVLDGLTLRTASQDFSEEIASWLSETGLAG